MDAYSMGTAIIANMHYIVVANDEVAAKLYEEQKVQYPNSFQPYNYEFNVDVKGSEADQIKAAKSLDKIEGVIVESRAANREDFYAMYGGFLFLGLFLGMIFVMATTLIIYYKQISEGYDDKVRFEIMQKVGMSKKEVKASIRSQIILVFFLPLAMAAIHLCFSYPMMEKLLGILNISNTDLFIWCLVATLGVFTFLYILVYSMTSKVYYKIVN